MGIVPHRISRLFSGRSRSRSPNIQNLPRTTYTTSTTDTTTSTYWPPIPTEEDIQRTMQRSGWTAWEVSEGLRMLAQAAVRASQSAREFRERVTGVVTIGKAVKSSDQEKLVEVNPVRLIRED